MQIGNIDGQDFIVKKVMMKENVEKLKNLEKYIRMGANDFIHDSGRIIVLEKIVDANILEEEPKK